MVRTKETARQMVDGDKKEGAAFQNRTIELREDNCRRRIGEVPTSLVRWGYVSIAVIIGLLLLAGALLPYPYSNGESLLRHFLFP